MYCITKTYTPLFNSRKFLLELNANGGICDSFHIRNLETVVFPNTSIKRVGGNEKIAEVLFCPYHETKTFYTTSSFIKTTGFIDNRTLPTKQEMLHKLKNFPKLPYLLGGNIPYPIFMQSHLNSDVFINRHRKLFGIDCSGLLYYVANGCVPRNTSQLMHYGKEVKTLLPLDLILYTGHVIIYLGEGNVIESREIDGVIVSKWNERKKTIKKPYKFIRWYF